MHLSRLTSSQTFLGDSVTLGPTGTDGPRRSGPSEDVTSFSPASAPRALAEEREGELFASFVGSAAGRGKRGGLAFWMSLSVHVTVVVAVSLGPIVWPTPLPEKPVDYVQVLLYDPPPPPPLPLPRGNPVLPEGAAPRERPRPQPEAPSRETLSPTPPDAIASPVERPPYFVPEVLSWEQWGSATGSDFGVPEGMEGGVLGGEVGGIPGGVIGGIIGGRLGGIVPAARCDRPPRVIRQTKPQYPQEAFVKKIQGTVLVEILINVDGRVAHARVLRSIPLLDEAALAAVRQWLFEPAVKNGRPVATLAQAPIGFRIY